MKNFQYFDIDYYDNLINTSEAFYKEPKLTPMKQQYANIKKQYPFDIILFQRGNFYMAYDEDARYVKQIVDCNWKEFEKSIGIHEQQLEKSIYEIVIRNRKVVLCEQISDYYAWDDNNLIPRQITGIYSKGLIGFGILQSNDLSIILISEHEGEYLVVDSIQKTAYYTQDITDIEYDEIISQKQIKTKQYFSLGHGDNALDQLVNYFEERKINGVSQLYFYDSGFNCCLTKKFCYISEKTIKNLFFKQLFFASTKDGQLKLEQILQRPLLDFKDRNQIMMDLSYIKLYRDKFLQNIKSIGNLRRKVGQIYNQKKNYLKLKEILEDLRKVSWSIDSNIISNQGLFKSEYLKQITLITDDISEFEAQIIWEGDNQEIPTPAINREKYQDLLIKIDSQWDLAYQEFSIKKQELFNQDPRVNLTRNYEIEVPEELDRNGLIFSSKRKGFKRFKTEILINAEKQEIIYKAKLKQFISEFYDSLRIKFIEKSNSWMKIVELMAQLDAFSTLSKYLEDDPESCFPEIQDKGIYFKQLRHPIILGIPNDLQLNDTMIISGVHGAGKSTLLRAVALNIILAQIGCRVPCKQMKFNPVQGILSRMGGQDSLTRSTFEIELMEVKQMFFKNNYLLLIDELGRGTSSIDGHSLAYALLRYMLEKQKSLILFATYYDIDLADNYYMENYNLKKGKKTNNLTQHMFNNQVSNMQI